MFLRHSLVAAFAIAALSAPAWAAEGNGEPFAPPDSSVVETPGITHYTMGSSAPFNYFYTPKPTVMGAYNPALGGAADPFPFKAAGHSIRTQPDSTPPSAIVTAPRNWTHG